MEDTLFAGLNPEQRAAVLLPRTSALVLAGAGSGKTRVLTTRIAHLIRSGQASPLGILAVTFTNKAAREMLARLSAMLPINTRGMWVGTFHGLCNRLLRAHFREAGLPALFQILDSQDQQGAIKRVLRAMGADEERYPPRQVAYFINSHKEDGIRAAAVKPWDLASRAMVEFYQAYEAQCRREGVVDFAELLLAAYELLNGDERLREHYRSRFGFILVDEFQDTNRLQYEWLKLLAGPQAAVFAVGDDDQSIYAFRGARVGNMRLFEQEFQVQQVIRLEQNYRSHGNILDAANALIANNQGRLGKNLWTEAGKGEPVRVLEAGNDMDEAAFIVDEVRALQAEGTPLSEIALLYRSNAQSRVLEQAIFNAGLPYRVYGGLRFFERMEVKHALAWLRLAAHADDDGAFLRVVNFPPRGIGARSLEQVQEQARALGAPLAAIAGQVRLAGKAAAGMADFLDRVGRLRAGVGRLNLAELVEEALALSGLLEHYRAEREGAERIENLEELVNAAASFENDSELDDLSAFLSHASLEAGEREAGAGVDALQLMTVHSAKGLEFRVVFVSGLEEGLFPHENALSENDGLEEERRLMYVAITRARQRLYLTRSNSRMLHGQVRYGLRSRFIDEIPAGLCRFVGGMQAPARDFVSQWSGHREAPGRSAPLRDGFGAGPASDAGLPFRIGQNVQHPKFGGGVILAAEGRGEDARVQVNFREAGVKWLALAYARLSAG
ncbi:MAG: UvrD-helicase domain-containing protein [Pseudomonadota bacterium]|nr:UvrD-helicase domain-containing protein [Pseudomonadota bacterium]